MIDQKQSLDQLPNEIKPALQELKVLKYLRDAGFRKKLGYACTRSFGGLFYLLCDEVGTLDWTIALQQLLELIQEVASKAGKKLSALIQRQLQQWIPALPSYIKAYLPISGCES
ncbi:hypothetical protein J2Z66_000992 [Paenibacillus eucommiae]|uniref:Uncharacterized protein n=1 Tax=Paenibacillus eucommiae TaxID=1355755 RepID=A0ABS4IPA6_9BACL|nr:hypothetical protein [Paenibacillus eucommiae]